MNPPMLKLIAKLLENVPDFQVNIEALIPDPEERRALVLSAFETEPQLKGWTPDPESQSIVWSAYYLARYVSRELSAAADHQVSLDTTSAREEVEARNEIGQRLVIGNRPRWVDVLARLKQNTDAKRLEVRARNWRFGNDGEFLAYVGIDATRWSDEYAASMLTAARAEELPDPFGWFANAIQAGIAEGYARAKRELEAARPPTELEREHGVGPGSEFPTLTASKITARNAEGAIVAEGVAIHKPHDDLPERAWGTRPEGASSVTVEGGSGLATLEPIPGLMLDLNQGEPPPDEIPADAGAAGDRADHTLPEERR